MQTTSFYTMMGFPPPLRSEFFVYQPNETILSHRPLQAFWSWLSPPDERMQEAVKFIGFWQRVWKHIPGVVSVYLADHITFNALQEGTPITLFIVTLPKRVRTTKVCVDMLCFFMSLLNKRRLIPFHLTVSFLVTTDNQDISRLLLSPSDPYLVYWIAHLVPIYYANFARHDEIYEKNQRISYYLPVFPGKQAIFLGTDILVGSSWLKQGLEWVMQSMMGGVIELVTHYLARVYMRFMPKKYFKHKETITVGSGIYSEGADKRKRYALQRELYKKTSYSTSTKEKEHSD